MSAQVCRKCDGKGAVRIVLPSRKPVPCFWFNDGAQTCDACDGTGESNA